MSTSAALTHRPAPPQPREGSSSSSSSSATALPPLPLPRVPLSSSSSSTPFSTELAPPPPPPPPPPRNAATFSAVTVPYFCPKHVKLATHERPPFPLYLFKRCPDCRLSGIHECDLPNYSSTASSSSSSSALYPPRTLPPPPRPPSPLDSSEYVLLFSSLSSTVWSVPTQTGLTSVTISDFDTTVTCAVCTDALPPPATACRLPCGHLYHSDCIVQWLSLRNSCPVCRRSVPMFPDHGTCTIEENAPSPPPHGPQTTATVDHRRWSLLGARWVRRICRRLLSYMEMSRPRQPS